MNVGWSSPKWKTVNEILGTKRKDVLRKDFEDLRTEYRSKEGWVYFDGSDSYHFRVEQGKNILVYELVS